MVSVETIGRYPPTLILNMNRLAPVKDSLGESRKRQQNIVRPASLRVSNTPEKNNDPHDLAPKEKELGDGSTANDKVGKARATPSTPPIRR